MTDLVLGGEIQTFDEDKREIFMRLVPWNVDAETNRGLERFEKGAFAGIDPSRFILRQRHLDPPTGRGISLEERDDALYMGFRVSRTIAGDEQLTLLKDGVETGVSVGFEDGEIEKATAMDGRKVLIHKRINAGGVLEASTTYKPAFQSAQVLQLRERETMPENQETPAEAQAVSPVQLREFESTIMAKVEELQERQTALQVASAVTAQDAKPGKFERRVELQIRALADVITTGNEGVVPDAVVNEMIGRIATGRPFLNGTRQIPAPSAGINLIMPKITQNPLVGTQVTEKTELASRATLISTVDFPMVTKGGAADLSMQLIKRSSPQFLELWLELLGEAYATNTEDGAIDALLAEAAVVEGGVMNPSNPSFGAAFTNTSAATGRTMVPDRIFLSTAAVAAFIDAKEPSGGGGVALYPGLAGISGLTSGSAPSGLGFNLLPVWCPELDDEAPDVIVGPSRGFVWAEDGTYTLQADVPAKFGRDVGLAGMIWYAPIYPAAFTSYTLV